MTQSDFVVGVVRRTFIDLEAAVEAHLYQTWDRHRQGKAPEFAIGVWDAFNELRDALLELGVDVKTYPVGTVGNPGR